MHCSKADFFGAWLHWAVTEKREREEKKERKKESELMLRFLLLKKESSRGERSASWLGCVGSSKSFVKKRYK